MIIVMKIGTAKEQIDAVAQFIKDSGLEPHPMYGVERTVFGVIGNINETFEQQIETLPGIDFVQRVSKPYKLASREINLKDSVVDIGGVTIGGETIVVMAGPCSVESEEQIVSTAKAIKKAGATLLRGGAYKPRTGPYNFQGLGKEGLELLALAREKTGLPIVAEVKTPAKIELACQYIDMIQIGARNMQNYDLLIEAGKSGKPVLLKRGLWATYEEWLLAAEYILSQNNPHVVLCERGIRTFENYTRNTLDITAVPVIKKLSHLPVIVDPSHGTGKWSLVEPLAKAALAAGADGLMIEVHPNPDKAFSDGNQSLTFANFEKLMQSIRPICKALHKNL